MSSPVLVRTDIQRRALEDLVSGQTVAQIAFRRGCTSEVVYAQLTRVKRANKLGTIDDLQAAARARGVAFAEGKYRGGNTSKRPPADVLERYAGMLERREISRAQVAREFGVSLSTLRRWLPTAGNDEPAVIKKPDIRESLAKPLPLIDREARSRERRHRELAKRAALRAEMAGN
jgi:DNA invertase Pin-like site-specific DNA recombinase